MSLSSQVTGLGNAAAIFGQAFLRGLRTAPIQLSVSEWADKFRYLSTRASAEPGRWNTRRTPYLREPMDSLSANDPTKEVSMLFGAQLGKSESGFNWIGYVIDVCPGPMLMVQPNMDMVGKVVKQRLDPAIAESPALAEKIAEKGAKAGGNSLNAKEFEGGILIMAGANAPAGLASMPIRYLFMDEVDRYPGDAGGEGDPVNLAKARTRTFSNSKILSTSTPTTAGASRIETSFNESDQRHFYVPCPDCGHMQTLKFANLIWDKEVVGEKEIDHPETARYMCEECGVLIPEYKKTQMLERGEWVAHNPSVKHHRGYKLSSLYSPLGWYSWAQIVADWLSAKKRPDQLKTFVNTVLAETWEERGDSPDWEAIYTRRKEYAFNTCPRGVLFLTAGVDVQRNRLEVEVVGWGREMRSWSVDYRVFAGDTSKTEVWADLWAMLRETWPVEGSEIKLKLEVMAVDSSDQTQVVYSQVRKAADARVRAVKGVDSQILPVAPPKAMDIDINGQKIYRGVMLWLVGVSLLKQELYGFIRQPPPLDDSTPYPVGYCEWPQYEQEYFKQLTAEQHVKRNSAKGRTVMQWVKKYERNEALDCRVYARAAAFMFGLDRFDDSSFAELESRLAQNAALPHDGGGKSQRVNPFTGQTGPYI